MVVNEFVDVWNVVHPRGLSAFLVCDNMTIHTNKDIVNAAARMRAYMYNMIPHSSHRLQVHDQEPFAILKQEQKQ